MNSPESPHRHSRHSTQEDAERESLLIRRAGNAATVKDRGENTPLEGGPAPYRWEVWITYLPPNDGPPTLPPGAIFGGGR